MKWKSEQLVFELAALSTMMVGIILMWLNKDPKHYFVYVGFIFLASGKLWEALHIPDPRFMILKVTLCVSMYLLVALNFIYEVRSLTYLMIPLVIYYLLHYRWVIQQRKA